MDTGVDNLPSTAGIDDFVQRRVLMRKLVVLGIALAAFLGLLCVGGYIRMKMFGSQDRSDRDWARDLHGSGVSNPAAARDPWGRPTPTETRGVEMASSHGLRSYH